MLKYYLVIKEALVFLNLLFAAVLLGGLLYFGAAVVSAVSSWGDRTKPSAPVEQELPLPAEPDPNDNVCEESEYSDPQNPCYTGDVD